jgi:hypothetical protein
MKTTIIEKQAVLTAENNIPADASFTMLNMLRFREQADYPSRPDIKPCSGREAYLEHYIPAFNKAAKAEGVTGIQMIYIGSVAAAVVAPADEHWDIIALVQYPNFAAFRKVSESLVYLQEAECHRQAALDDLRLIATTAFPSP